MYQKKSTLEELSAILQKGWRLEISYMNERYYGILSAPRDRNLPYGATALGGARTVEGLIWEAIREMKEAEGFPGVIPCP